MVHLTFASQFNAVHRLWSDSMSEEENRRVFGECANPSGHGHLYRIEITVARRIGSDEPVTISRGAIARIIGGVLRPKLEHGNLDTAFGVARFVSTGENVTRQIWSLVQPALPGGVTLVAVRVIETPKNSFVYCGDGADPRSVPMF